MTSPEQQFYRPDAPPPVPSPVDYPEYPRSYPVPRPPGTNNLATASLVISALGIPLGVPLTLLCSIGALMPIIGMVLGVVALTQIRQTGRSGRELAIGGIVLGAVLLALLVVLGVALFSQPITPAG